MNPSLEKIKQLKARGVTVSSKSKSYDYTSRFFGPQSGIDEDAATGSIHTYLSLFWGEKLKKNSLKAIQLSKRGGIFYCKLNGDRVEISGNAKLYLKGEIFI